MVAFVEMSLDSVVQFIPHIIGSGFHLAAGTAITSETLEEKLSFKDRIKTIVKNPRKLTALSFSIIPDSDYFIQLAYQALDPSAELNGFTKHRSYLTHSPVMGIPFAFTVGYMVGYHTSKDRKTALKTAAECVTVYSIAHITFDLVQSGTMCMFPFGDLALPFDMPRVLSYVAQGALLAGIMFGPKAYTKYIKPYLIEAAEHIKYIYSNRMPE